MGFSEYAGKMLKWAVAPIWAGAKSIVADYKQRRADRREMDADVEGIRKMVLNRGKLSLEGGEIVHTDRNGHKTTLSL